ncbi:MAG: hypothetical protein GY719_30380 [bacterium]|nr:hypothetical protein [bacterium]
MGKAANVEQRELAWEMLRPLDQWLWVLKKSVVAESQKGFPFKGRSKKLPVSILDRIKDRDGVLERVSRPPGGILRTTPRRFLGNHFSSILLDVRLREWVQFIEQMEARHLPMTDAELAPIKSLSKIWSVLSGDSRRDSLGSIEVFARFLVDALTWSYVGVERIENFRIHLVKVEQTNVNLPHVIPIVFTFVEDDPAKIQDRLADTLHLQKALEQSRRAPRGVVLNIVVGEISSSRKYLQLISKDDRIIPLDEKELQRLFLARRYSRHFNRLIRLRIGIGRLNPYTTEKPVERLEMFFGRADEVDKILSRPGTDYMVVGSRRIGKSSLLKYLEKITAKSEERAPIYLDCSSIGDPDIFAKALAGKINPRRVSRIKIGNLVQLVRASQSVKKMRYLLLMDEVDALVEHAAASQDWRIFEVLRELSNARTVQSIFTGYTVLYEAWKNLKSPLFNFVSLIYLSTLTKHSARKLVTEPMAALGVTFKSRRTVKEIINETGGHPSFLQFFCSSLVEVLDSKKDLVITGEERQQVRSRDDYYAVLLQPFQLDDNFSALEKLIVLHLTKSNIDTFEVTPLIESLEESGLALGAEVVVEALQNLVITGLLRVHQGEQPEERKGADLKYEWTIPAFPVALWRTYPVAREVERMVKFIKTKR